MRKQIFIRDAFNRDTSWITQEVIEEFAGAKLRGDVAAARCAAKWTNSDQLKINLFFEMMDEAQDDIRLLQDELVDEFGIEYFIGKAKTREQHIRECEIAIENSRDAKDKAALYKELRELRGWTLKPAEAAPAVTVNNNILSSDVRLERGDLRNAERIVMSVFGSV